MKPYNILNFDSCYVSQAHEHMSTLDFAHYDTYDVWQFALLPSSDDCLLLQLQIYYCFF